MGEPLRSMPVRAKRPGGSEGRRRSPARTRSLILDAALEVMLQRDSMICSVDDIVQASGFTRGALYHHFSGKPDLILAVVDERLLPWAESVLDLRWLDLGLSFSALGRRVCAEARAVSSHERAACRLLCQGAVAEERNAIQRRRERLWTKCKTTVVARLERSRHELPITPDLLAQLLMTAVAGSCMLDMQ